MYVFIQWNMLMGTARAVLFTGRMPFRTPINSIQILKDNLITKCGRQIKIAQNWNVWTWKVPSAVSDSYSHI